MQKKNRILRALSLCLLLCLLVGALASCGLFGKGGTLADRLQDKLNEYTTPATTTSDPQEGGEHTVSAKELSDFLALVDREKAEIVESYYYYNYVIETPKTIDECCPELFYYLVANYYIERVTDKEEATAIFINSYIDVLGDKYGYYYGPSEADDYTADMQGKYSGIGVQVSLNEENYIDILTVFSGSPAERAGILPGDVLVAVEGEDIAEIGYQATINRIRGEIGTSVTVTLRREGEPYTVSVTREEVVEVTASGKMLEGNIGYIKITSFDDTTYAQFVSAHRALEQAGAESFVFDVRNNPGGALNSVVAILEYILPGGDICHMRYKNTSQNKTIKGIADVDPTYMGRDGRVYYENHKIDLPMTVLANENTASAGELFTSTLRDRLGAEIIGAKTYGKGVGQSGGNVTSDGSFVMLTYFYYDPPTSGNYNGVGITPDQAVALSPEAAKKNLSLLSPEEDAQLQAALSYLKGIAIP